MANSRAYTLAGFTLLFFLGILGTLFFLADLRQLGDVISHLDTRFLALAAVVTTLSYFLNYLAFQGLARSVECRLGSADLFRIAFASATVSCLFSAGGVSGMTLRLYFLRKQGIRTHTTLIISLVSTMLNNLVLLMFVVGGFGRLMINGDLSLLQKLVSGLILTMSTMLVGAAFLSLYHRGVLDAVLKLVVRTARRVAGALPMIPGMRHVTEARLESFRREFHEATALITSHRRKIAIPFLYLLLEWAAAAGVLHLCFLATGYPMSPGILAAGFSVGVFIFLISVVPGGLGIMEASMAGVFVSLGVPFEKVLVALLAYRVLYYFLPFGVSLLLCGKLLREAGQMAGMTDRPLP